MDSETPKLQLDPALPAELRNAVEQLLPLLYADLRRLARRERRRVSADATLQTTALVHEAYLKLRDSALFADHGHFLRAAALAMRHVLVNYARDRVAAKRGGGAKQLPLDHPEVAEIAGLPVESDETLVAVHEALDQLAQLNPRLAQVVECRFFAGYNEQETAEALGLNERTVRRDWVKARAWLKVELDLA